MLYYADVILPLALDRPYTYAVEKQDFLFLKPGFRVAVSFGKSKVYTGVVIKLHNLQPQRYTPKFIEFILEDSPSISKRQLELCYVATRLSIHVLVLSQPNQFELVVAPHY